MTTDTATEKSVPLAEGRYRSNVLSPYREWVRAEGLPLIETNYVRSLHTIELADWRRKQARGVVLNHDGSRWSNDSYVLELAPAAATPPERHLFEEMVYVLSGQGTTTVWYDDATKRSFEWGPGALFSVPLNAWYRHDNVSGRSPARLFGVTTAPLMINALRDPEFIFGCDHQFRERYDGSAEYFSGTGTQRGMLWEGNFIPDVRTLTLLDYRERGAGSTHIKLRLAKNSVGAHVSEFPVGTYKKGHRHGPGAHVVILGGAGYSLMWKEGEPLERFPWEAGTLIVPFDRAFHQHFNTGDTPARYLALKHDNSNDAAAGGELPRSSISGRLGGDQIDYRDEDPQVRDLFLAELARNAVRHRMDRSWAEG